VTFATALDTARRELCPAFFLKNPQSRSEQDSARVHAVDVAVILKISIPSLRRVSAIAKPARHPLSLAALGHQRLCR
jgi:hypothetical protein